MSFPLTRSNRSLLRRWVDAAAVALAVLTAVPVQGQPPGEPGSLVIEGERTGRFTAPGLPPAPAPDPADDGPAEGLDEPIRFKPMRALTIQTAVSPGDLPASPADAVFAAEGTIHDNVLYGMAVPSRCLPTAEFFHRPLYFEDVSLEVYGRSHGCLQPLVSAAKFYGMVPLLPYRMLVEPPHSCVSSQRYCYGYTGHEWLRYEHDAALVQAGVVAGLILLIP